MNPRPSKRMRPVGFVRKQEDPPAEAGGGPLEKLGEGGECGAIVDAPGRIVGRVDDHEARPWSDRRLDRREVEVEVRPPQGDRARYRVCRQEHRLVAEPRRLGEDRLVADVENEVKGEHDRREGTGGERDVLRLECEPELASDPFGEKGLRLRLARLVGKPVLVVRNGSFPDGGDQPGKGHLVRIAEGEIRNAGLEATLAIARGEVELLHLVGDGVRCGDAPGYDGDGHLVTPPWAAGRSASSARSPAPPRSCRPAMSANSGVLR